MNGFVLGIIISSLLGFKNYLGPRLIFLAFTILYG